MSGVLGSADDYPPSAGVEDRQLDGGRKRGLRHFRVGGQANAGGSLGDGEIDEGAESDLGHQSLATVRIPTIASALVTMIASPCSSITPARNR